MNDLEQTLLNQKDELQLINYKAIISRKEESLIDLDSDLAQIVIGVRRCGKSTLCQKILHDSGKVFAYANFDDPSLAILPPIN